MTNNKLDRKEMERLMPDYLFGRLGDSESKLFEANLSEHSDILNEINDAKKVFQTADLMSYDTIIGNQSKDISFKVNQRLVSQKQGTFSLFGNRFTKYSIPLAAAIAMGYFGLTSDIFNTDNSSTELISHSDMEMLFDNGNDNNNTPLLISDTPFSLSSNDIIYSDAESTEELHAAIDEWVLESSNDDDLEGYMDYELEELIENEEDLQLLYGES